LLAARRKKMGSHPGKLRAIQDLQTIKPEWLRTLSWTQAVGGTVCNRRRCWAIPGFIVAVITVP
jgi:hypothetical protein